MPTINFKGVNYPSVEAMPPDVRAAYEQSDDVQEQADLAEFLKAAGEAGVDLTGPDNPSGTGPIAGMEAFKPAWGGAQPGGGVPVPAAYQAVSGLGQAVKVYEHDGLDLDLLHLGTPHINSAVRYREGFAYQAGGKQIHTWRWEEVASITSDFVQANAAQNGGYPQHDYTLVRQNGENLVLSSGRVKEVNELGAAIKQAVFAHLGPPLAQQYKNGSSITFGSVTVQQANGIQMDGKPYAWATIQDIKIEGGRLTITLRDLKKHSVRAKTIPNVEILCQLLGVACGDFDLKYWPGL